MSAFFVNYCLIAQLDLCKAMRVTDGFKNRFKKLAFKQSYDSYFLKIVFI